jgi:hypothetical protein
MDSLKKLEERVSDIESRNRRVEGDKAWSDSWTRRILIALFTYLSIALYFRYILQNDPWFNAIVPTIGFLLSTLTLPYFKKFWLKRFYKK